MSNKPERCVVEVVEVYKDATMTWSYPIRVVPQPKHFPHKDNWVYLNRPHGKDVGVGELIVIERDEEFDHYWGYRLVTEEEYATTTE